MECLDGLDLRERAPLPWRQSCALLREVASSLALLHSRRLVHRDLTPRNVRCTQDGRAKLIDFGAMVPMGLCRQVVGTPPYMAPELVHGQELDGRADLFALGALLYWTLTGKHAFFARDVRQLRDAWRTRPPAPSSFDATIPRELDVLVISLLSFEPLARPATAAEVIGRLGAIAGLPVDETLAHTEAYLTTPTLVGRAEEQLSSRKRVLRALRGQGSCLLIEGTPGMGKSRLLASLALEARLAGAVVLSAAAGDSSDTEYALLHALVARLFEAAPEPARVAARPHAPALACFLPHVYGGATEEPESGPAAAQPEAVREALVEWFLDIARVRTLCLAIDDLHRADAASAAFIARLAVRTHEQQLIVAVSAELGGGGPLARVIAQVGEHGARTVARPLDGQQTLTLLRSLFGDVPHLSATAAWVGRLSQGNPGLCMQLARHLVERGIARFAEGRWTLPQSLDTHTLPASFEQALEARFADLDDCARTIAQLLTISTPFAPLALPDYVKLLAFGYSSKQVFHALDELTLAEMITSAGDGYALRDRSVADIAMRSLVDAERRKLHDLLARHYEMSGHGLALLSCHHSWHAGDRDLAFDRVGDLVGTISEIRSPNALFGRTGAGLRLLEETYAYGRARAISPAREHGWQKVLLQLACVHDPTLSRYVDQTLSRLRAESGCMYWHEYPELPQSERLQRCFERAQLAYEQTPEQARGLAPLEAIRELAVICGVLGGLCARTLDVERWVQLTALLEPFVQLAPVVEVLHELSSMSVAAVLQGWDVTPRRRRLIARLSEPIAGMDELTRQGAIHLLVYYRALESAMSAAPEALDAADELARNPSYAALAWQIRMIYELSRGDRERAECCRDQRALLALTHTETDTHLARSLVNEVQIAARSCDLMALKRLLPDLEREAALFPGWRPWHAFAAASYGLLRGELGAARQAVESGLSELPAVGHPAWFELVPLRLHLLVKLGSLEQADQAADAARAQLAARGMSPEDAREPLALQIALAHVDIARGRHASAAAYLDQVIARRLAASHGGLALAMLHEARARAALAAADTPTFERQAALAVECLGRHRHTGFVANLQQLIDDARRAEQPVSLELERSLELGSTSATVDTSLHTSVFTMLGTCRGADERAARALRLLIERAHASGGYLYGASSKGLQLLAAQNVPVPDGALEQRARRCFEAARNDDEEATRVEGAGVAIDDFEIAHLGIVLRAFILCRVGRSADQFGGVVLLAAREGQMLAANREILTAVCEGLMRADDIEAVAS